MGKKVLTYFLHVLHRGGIAVAGHAGYLVGTVGYLWGAKGMVARKLFWLILKFHLVHWYFFKFSFKVALYVFRLIWELIWDILLERRDKPFMTIRIKRKNKKVSKIELL